MSPSPFKDPLTLWRETLDKWERQANEVGGKLLGTSEFSGAMNKASVVSLQMQKMLGEFMAKYLASLNLPSRDDVTALAERVGEVERLLHRVLNAMDVPQKEGPAPASPPRTRKPATARKPKS